MCLENNGQSYGSICEINKEAWGNLVKGHMKEFGLPINGNPSKVDLPHIHFYFDFRFLYSV